MRKDCLNNLGRMKKNVQKIKIDDIIPNGLQRGIISQEITSNFVLELYEKSKALKGKKKKDMLSIAEKLSKNIGKWLVE